MASIYENVCIGGFIFALGHKMGREMPDAFPLASVNLYQQTPLDPSLGDLLVDLSGLCVLLEFKRSWKQAPSELEKHSEVDFGAEVERLNLTEVANTCHYLGFAVPGDGRQFDINFCSYLALWDAARNDQQPTSVVRIDKFLQDILSGNIGVASDRLREYVDVLSGRDAGDAACLIVNYSREEGVQLFIVDDISLLQTTRAELEEAREAKERQRKRQRQEPPENLRVRIRQ